MARIAGYFLIFLLIALVFDAVTGFSLTISVNPCPITCQKSYTQTRSCSLFAQVSNDYCWFPFSSFSPSGFNGNKTVKFYSILQSGMMLGMNNQYARLFSSNMSIVVPSGIKILNNVTDLRFNGTAVLRIGMTVHFRSDSIGNCPPTGAKITLQNATGLTQINPWTNLISVPIDCNAGTSLWDSFGNGITPCSSFLGLLAGSFDCFENSTRILTNLWGNNPCTGNQQNCPETFFNGQFFRLVVSGGDSTTQTFIYSVDLTITEPVIGYISLFSGNILNNVIIELIWTGPTSYLTSGSSITVSLVTTCTIPINC